MIGLLDQETGEIPAEHQNHGGAKGADPKLTPSRPRRHDGYFRVILDRVALGAERIAHGRFMDAKFKIAWIMLTNSKSKSHG